MMMNWDLIPQWKRHAQNCIDFCLFFTVFAELCNRNNSFWYWCFVFLWHFLSVLLIFLFLNSLMTVFFLKFLIPFLQSHRHFNLLAVFGPTQAKPQKFEYVLLEILPKVFTWKCLRHLSE